MFFFLKGDRHATRKETILMVFCELGLFCRVPVNTEEKAVELYLRAMGGEGAVAVAKGNGEVEGVTHGEQKDLMSDAPHDLGQTHRPLGGSFGWGWNLSCGQEGCTLYIQRYNNGFVFMPPAFPQQRCLMNSLLTEQKVFRWNANILVSRRPICKVWFPK